jgi:peptidyl-tRNA hydrolase
MADPVVQYVVVRTDLVQSMGWPLGSVVAQACHAAVAIIWRERNHSELMREYFGENDELVPSMHTVVLGISSEEKMMNLSAKLDAGEISHHLWREQPENIVTALASVPARKSVLSPFFRSLKLLR